MEIVKKLLVLISSIILIGAVIYLIAISSVGKRLVPEVSHDMKYFYNDSLFIEDSLGSEVIPQIPDEGITLRRQDSINWKIFPETGIAAQQDQANSEINVKAINNIFRNAAKRILPAVVSVRSSREFDNLPGDHPDIFPPGAGSGILISADGYILTNFHVVKDANELRIILYDKREFEAQYIGGDPTTDVALIKIEGRDLPAAMMGNSDSLQVGDWVLAVGNPLSFQSTITAGIISAFGRDINIINEEYRIENFIQTDAVINPGNSGGALVNLDSKVIGVNTAIATRTGFNQGYGFAIPINLARKVVDDLAKFGYVRRGIIGVSIAGMDAKSARALGLTKPMGVLIQSVREGFPAAEVGLRQGDVILSVNGKKVNSPSELQTKIARNYPGTKVVLLVWRDNQKVPFDVILGEAPVEKPKVRISSKKKGGEYKNLGMGLVDFSSEKITAVIVESVKLGSPAHRAGVFQNDLITKINDVPVNSTKDFTRILNNSKSGEVLKFQVKQLLQGNDNLERIIFIELP
jgi:serine protease Do